MRGIAKLLFGDDAGGLPGLFSLPGDGDGFEMADRARRSGEWCGSTPGRGSADRAVRGADGPRGARRRVTSRDFRGL